MNYSAKMSHVGGGYFFKGNTSVSQLTAVIDTLLVGMPCCNVVNVMINYLAICEITLNK